MILIAIIFFMIVIAIIFLMIVIAVIFMMIFVMTRVEFSKPNIEISITVTKASKLWSFGRLYSHNFPHHFHHYLPHHSHYFLQQYFFFIFAKNRKKIILGRSIGATMQKHKKSWKNALEIGFFSLFEYPNLGHRFSVSQMARIYLDFG